MFSGVTTQSRQALERQNNESISNQLIILSLYSSMLLIYLKSELSYPREGDRSFLWEKFNYGISSNGLWVAKFIGCILTMHTWGCGCRKVRSTRK